MNKTISLKTLLIVSAIALTLVSSAQVNLGGPRAAGMGGAGLALPVDPANNGKLNPAIYGLLKHGFHYSMPEVGYDSHGISLSGLRDQLKSTSNAGVNGDQSGLDSYARAYGSRDTEFGINEGLGLGFGQFDLSVDGKADVTSKPNAILSAWTNAGSPGTIPDGARLDAYGYAYYSVNASFGAPIPVTTGQLLAGVRGKFVHAYYAHDGVGYSAGTVTGTNTRASEMGGNATLDAKGFGVDGGVLYTLGTDSRVHFGLVVENLIEPNVAFDKTAPGLDINSPQATTSFNPFKRAVNVGFGLDATKDVSIAADAIDLGNHADRRSYRIGVDYSLPHGFGLRAGYDSAAKLSAGFTVLGFNVMFAGRNAASLAYSLHF